MRWRAIALFALVYWGMATGCGGRVVVPSEGDTSGEAPDVGSAGQDVSPIGDGLDGPDAGLTLDRGAGAARADGGAPLEEVPTRIEVWVGQVERAITLPELREQEYEPQPQRVVIVLDIDASPEAGTIRFGNRESPPPDVHDYARDAPVEGFDYTLEDIHVEGDRLEMSFATIEILCALGLRSSCSGSMSGLRGLIRLDLARNGDDLVGNVLIRNFAGMPPPAIRLQRVQ